MTTRVSIEVSGAVQGVGFRPFVYRLATYLGLSGFVMNTGRGVSIEITGDKPKIDEFLDTLTNSPPPLAVINNIQRNYADVDKDAPVGPRKFRIIQSKTEGDIQAIISPDYATCPDCINELFDKDDRRYRYPFINCTNCGPRYTIIQSIPYDRQRTTMASFEMCPECKTEYEGPDNRRFHAEPTCCPSCGPHVWITDKNGRKLEFESAIDECIRLLAEGRTVAIKGLGGFHLACDASNDEAVAELRRRKIRSEKPFAVMLRDLESVIKIAVLSETQSSLLTSCQCPIVLVPKCSEHGLSEKVAPNSSDFGVMLPYTPLHHLLMHNAPYSTLVMTSGNASEEPIAYENDDAMQRLSGIADAFLLHDRPIHIRTDDSVIKTISDRPCFLRRSRGYAPFPIELTCDTSDNEILAVGPDLKNTVCITRNGRAYMSHHVGDLANASAYESFIQAGKHMCDILEVSPANIACDTHPGYHSTTFAHANELNKFEVQHHHAHIASVLAEYKRTDNVIGIAFDGAGWGENGEIWGGEFLICDLADYERKGHAELIPLPGGDITSKRPERMAYVFLNTLFGVEADKLADQLLPNLAAEERAVMAQMIDKGLNCHQTSSIGRVFDAASALLGVCNTNTYEGQAAMELESRAALNEDSHYEMLIEQDIHGTLVMHTKDIIRELVVDFINGTSAEICAARFHNALAYNAAEVCDRIRSDTEINAVALSGGVFANALLTERLTTLLNENGFEVLKNRNVPPGDGGVSLGQAAIASWRMSCV